MQALTHKDLAPKRLDRLRRIILQDHVVRIDQLCQQLGVSPATVRRDLEELESAGDILRVHGGAVSAGGRLEEPLFEDKASIASEEKRRIAQAALKYIQPNDIIYLDGGSTILELARLLRERSNLTVVTNSLQSAIELAASGPRLILVGGEVRRLSQTTVGALTRLTLQQLHIDKAFLGTMGLSLEEGLTTTDPSEAFTKELVMEHAREVILLADHTKIGKISFTRSGRLETVRVLVTDGLIDPKQAAGFRKIGIEVVRA